MLDKKPDCGGYENTGIYYQGILWSILLWPFTEGQTIFFPRMARTLAKKTDLTNHSRPSWSTYNSVRLQQAKRHIFKNTHFCLLTQTPVSGSANWGSRATSGQVHWFHVVCGVLCSTELSGCGRDCTVAPGLKTFTSGSAQKRYQPPPWVSDTSSSGVNKQAESHCSRFLWTYIPEIKFEREANCFKVLYPRSATIQAMVSPRLRWGDLNSPYRYNSRKATSLVEAYCLDLGHSIAFLDWE